MRRSRTGLLGVGLAVWVGGGCVESRPLDIYFIDMVGGAATLVVTPEGESILVDSGSALERDAERICHAVRDAAGLSGIDHVVTTHWHLDHYGALGLLEGRLEFGRFYDRGIPDTVPEDLEHFPQLIAAYKRVSEGRSVALRPGDEIPLRQPVGVKLRLSCLMADRRVDAVLSKGARPNPYCDRHEPKDPDNTENGKSLVMLLSYGDFDFLLPGDLTWNLERDFVCPANRAGRVELLQVSHHGLASSSNPVFVHAVEPKVAMMLNGPRKGAALETMQTLRASPSSADVWQMHRNLQTEEAGNAPANRVANRDAPEGGVYIKVSVDGAGRRFGVQVGADGVPVWYSCWE